jgi:hypothetical protein
MHADGFERERSPLRDVENKDLSLLAGHKPTVGSWCPTTPCAETASRRPKVRGTDAKSKGVTRIVNEMLIPIERQPSNNPLVEMSVPESTLSRRMFAGPAATLRAFSLVFPASDCARNDVASAWLICRFGGRSSAQHNPMESACPRMRTFSTSGQ